jgi:hypothetical protein
MSHCHFVHGKMVLGQVFPRVHWFYLISHIPPTVIVNIVYSQRYISTSMGVLRHNLQTELIVYAEEVRLNKPTLSIIHIY